MTKNTETFDPAWDAIDTIATEVAEFEGGKLYKQNALHLDCLPNGHNSGGAQVLLAGYHPYTLGRV